MSGPVRIAQLSHRLGITSLTLNALSMAYDLNFTMALRHAIAEAARVLEPGGRFHLAIVHPINSGGAFEPADDHSASFVLRDSYFERRRTVDAVERAGLPMTFHSEHRPLRFYTRLLAEHGFLIETLDEIEEPRPGDRWNRMPLFLHIVARCLSPGP